MRRFARGLATAVVVAAAIGAMAAEAQAGPEIELVVGRFDVGGIKGAVVGDGSGRKDTAGVVTFASTPRQYRSTEYVTRRARLDGSRIRAKFGSRDAPTAQGSMRVRFVPRRTDRSGGGCLTITEQSGVLKGRARFRGEGGYVRLDKHRLRGYRFRVNLKGRCSLAGHAPGREPVTLAACSQDGQGFFGAQALERDGVSLFAGYAKSTRRGAMRSYSYFQEIADPSAFQYAADLSSAFVAPPAPIQGSATYSAADAYLGGRLSWRALNGKRVVVTPSDAAMARDDEVGCGRGRAPLFAQAALVDGELRAGRIVPAILRP
jgi:hypothetical protein